MKVSSLLLFATNLVVILTTSVGGSFVELTALGYSNLLVKIDSDVPSSNCQSIIKNLKELFVEASTHLCEATEKRAFFGDVKVMIPDSWAAIPDCPIGIVSTLSWPRAYKADVIIDQSHPLYGDNPFSLQYGGCGVESLHTRLSTGFLAQSKRGINFVHEWFHFRYGVFDEIGVADDPFYPVGYNISTKVGNSLLPTTCSNVPVIGQWNQSQWQMNDEDNKNVNSSLMYTTHLSSIKLPCTKETHTKASPTKQNFLCASRSVSQVVLSHRDFTSEPFSQCGTPTITFTKNPLRGYHVILDVSSFMKESMEDAKFAISHFIWLLPDGTYFSLDTYGDSHNAVIQPVILNRPNAKKVIDTIQKLECQSSNSTAGLALALNRAIEHFHLGMEIVVVTAAPTTTDNFTEMIDAFNAELIAPHILALNRPTMEAFASLAHEGGLYFIPYASEANGGALMKNRRTWLVDTLHALYSRTLAYRGKVNEETLAINKQVTNGTFHLDASSGSFKFAMYELEKNYAFDFGQGMIYSPTGSGCQISFASFGLINAQCNIIEAGTWSYTITLELYNTTQLRLDVWMENEAAVKIETWTSSPVGSPADANSLVIYALVTLGKRPAIGVDLIARITGDNQTQPLIVHLNENNAYDVTLNDGIYSAFVSVLPQYATSFTYVVEAVNSSGVVAASLVGGHVTAGSKIPVKNAMNVARFKRYVYGGSFYLAQPSNNYDVWPPERVKDLRVVEFHWESLTFHLKWTAPRDDYGASSTFVFTHRITWEDELSKVETLYIVKDLRDNSTNNEITFKIELPAVTNQTQQIYVRVYGIDSEGNIGSPSNIATIQLTFNDETKGPDTKLPPALFWTLIGIGCAIVILIIAVTVFFVMKRCAKKRKKNSANTWITHGDKEDSRRVEFNESEFTVNRQPSIISSESSYSSNWSGSVRSSHYSSESCSDQVTVRPFTIEWKNPATYRAARNEDAESTSVESVTYAIPTKIVRNNMQGTSANKKRPPMPPPRRYFGISSRPPVPAKFDEEFENQAVQYTRPHLRSNSQQNAEWEESIQRRQIIDRYFAILGVESEASLV